MENVSKLMVLAMFVMTTNVALADQQVQEEPEKPAATEFFSDETSNCMARCEVNPSHQPAVKASEKKPAKAKRSSRSRGARATAVAIARVEMGLFRKLEARVTVLEDRADGHDEKLAALREELANLKDASANANANVVVEDGSDAKPYDDSAILASLAALEERLDKMEEVRKNPFGNSVGLTAGVLMLAGHEDFRFVSPFIGARLNLGLNSEFHLYVEPQLMVTDDEHPFSAGIAGGIGYRLFGSGVFAGTLEIGILQVAMAIRSDLDARAMASLATAGLSFRLPKNFRAGAAVHLGPRFVPDMKPAISGGASLFAGYDFR